MQPLYSVSMLEQSQLMVMAAPRDTENGNAVCLIFGVHMYQKLLEHFSMAHLRDLLLGTKVGFMTSDLRS